MSMIFRNRQRTQTNNYYLNGVSFSVYFLIMNSLSVYKTYTMT